MAREGHSSKGWEHSLMSRTSRRANEDAHDAHLNIISKRRYVCGVINNKCTGLQQHCHTS
jgi:hypothetical protein